MFYQNLVIIHLRDKSIDVIERPDFPKLLRAILRAIFFKKENTVQFRVLQPRFIYVFLAI